MEPNAQQQITFPLDPASVQILVQALKSYFSGSSSGVTSAIAGTGISVDQATGNVTITNTGVLQLLAGTGIGVSAATGSITISATGVLSIIAGSGISVSNSGGNVTITATGTPTGFPTRFLGQQHANVIGTSLTKVQFTTIAVDNNSEWDNVNFRLVVKSGGTYVFYAQTPISSGSTLTTIDYEVLQNGTNIAHSEMYQLASASSNVMLVVSGVAVMAANDYLELWASRNGNGGIGDGSNQSEFMYIYRIS
jgi:hypothetical protein